MLQVHLTSIKNSTRYMRPSKHFKSYTCGNYRVAGSGVCLGFIMISVYGVLINTLYMYILYSEDVCSRCGDPQP